jgi:molybdate transport system substrate-binding protein
MKIFPSLVLLATTLAALPVHGAELVVAAPVELAECADALSSAFLAEEKDLRLRFMMGTSEKLYAKVSAGAPADVYLSTHLSLQAQLLADGKMVYESWTMYAAGRLVLWAADKRVDVSKGLSLLANPVVKVATVDGGSSYLLATLIAINQAVPLDTIKPRLLERHSMQDLVKAVRDKQAQVAILSYETVLASPMKGVGHYYLIPESKNRDAIVGHGAVVTLHGKPNPAAYRFVHFLRSAKAQAILIPKGFMKPLRESVDIR